MRALAALFLAAVVLTGCGAGKRPNINDGEPEIIGLDRTRSTFGLYLNRPGDWTVTRNVIMNGNGAAERWTLPEDQAVVLHQSVLGGYAFNGREVREDYDRFVTSLKEQGYTITEKSGGNSRYWMTGHKGTCIGFLSVMTVSSHGFIIKSPTHIWQGIVCGDVTKQPFDRLVAKLRPTDAAEDAELDAIAASLADGVTN